MTDSRKPLDAAAFGLMLVLTATWGFQQVAIKSTAPDVTLVMQAAIRSFVATGFLLLWILFKRIPLTERDATLVPGLLAGALFGAEFVFIYAGLAYTLASRMAVFIYLAPVLTALGLHCFVPSERLRALQWAGVALAFGGIVLAFWEGGAALGDAFGAIAALLWAATTVLIRATSLARAHPAKTLLYQIAMSAPILLATSVLMGERGVIALTPLAFASLAYQSVVVAFASYLAWFWLLTRYLATRLSVFSFLTPLFGVLFGVWLLNEPITAAFAGAAVLVGAGIALVNLRRPA